MKCARRLETLTRDEQQLDVGLASLEESQKAIEQAEISIQEGKRMKMRGSYPVILYMLSILNVLF